MFKPHFFLLLTSEWKQGRKISENLKLPRVTNPILVIKNSPVCFLVLFWKQPRGEKMAVTSNSQANGAPIST